MVMAAERLAAFGKQIEQTASAPSAPVLTQQQRETAQYVADMILELRNMAKAARLFTITVPLEYSYYEAFSIANRVQVPEGELERLRELARSAKEQEQATSLPAAE